MTTILFKLGLFSLDTDVQPNNQFTLSGQSCILARVVVLLYT